MTFTSRYEKPIKPDKGKQGGSCNRTACQDSYGAFCYNHPMQAYYCIKCAREINRHQVDSGGKPFIDIPENYLELVEQKLLTEGNLRSYTGFLNRPLDK